MATGDQRGLRPCHSDLATIASLLAERRYRYEGKAARDCGLADVGRIPPLIPKPERRGRPCEVDCREVVSLYARRSRTMSRYRSALDKRHSRALAPRNIFFGAPPIGPGSSQMGVEN